MTVFLFAKLILVLIACWQAITILRRWGKRHNAAKTMGCQSPPSLPQKDPLLGLDLVYQRLRALSGHSKNTSQKLEFEKYGYTFQSQSFGTTKIFTIDPLNVQTVLAKEFTSWGVEPLRLFPFKPFIGRGIMNSDGSFWEHSRSLLRPAFARAQIADFSAYGVHITHLLDSLPKDGSTVDLQPLFARLGLDSSTRLLFGQSVNSLEPESASVDAKTFLASYNTALRGVGRRMHLPQWNIFTRDVEFQRCCRFSSDFVDKQVDKAFERSATGDESGKYTLADELTKETQNRIDIRNQLLNVFLPAHDAAAVTLTNMFFLLARHPSVWTKLRTEIMEHGFLTSDSTNITFEGLKDMRYLRWVINETIRLHPPIAMISRAALQDTTLPEGGGHDGKSPIFVTKGSVVAISFYALHRRKDLFGDDADSFCPERWEHLRPQYFSYLPFGGGPRTCPGQQLTLAEVSYTVVRFLQRFSSIENRDPVMEYVEVYKISTESKNGAQVSLGT